MFKFATSLTKAQLAIIILQKLHLKNSPPSQCPCRDSIKSTEIPDIHLVAAYHQGCGDLDHGFKSGW